VGGILGISAYYHDASAAIVRDGEIIAAAQEERFSRVRHDPRFPRRAINYCLSEALFEAKDLDAVVFYDSPRLTLDRIIKNGVGVAPSGREEFIAACASLLGEKARLADDLNSILGSSPRLLVTNHHLAHAASCYFPSPFDDAAILTIDGVGEWATTTLGLGTGSKISLLKELRYPHSLGLFYSAFTYFCGFKVNSGEYKLMGLAPYGEPHYAPLIRNELIDVKDDGSFRLNTDAFGFLNSSLMTNARFEQLFGGEARRPEAPITKREMDIAASVQLVTEEIVLRLVAHVVGLTGVKTLAMAGGVALNCVANGRIARECGLDGLFVQPAAGDAGGALGAALLVSHQEFGAPRRVTGRRDRMRGALLGPSFSAVETAAFLDRHDAPNEHVPDARERARLVAEAIDDGMVVGLFSGRMEFGPRALGARSILGDARRPDMQSRMNLKVKCRESFRPFAPSVLAERAADYFELNGESPYMLRTAYVRPERRQAAAHIAGDDLTTIINTARSDVPAATHVDYSARVQTVGDDSNPEFRRILEAFYERTGCALLVNTSFNVRGEPIVCAPQDAYHCFLRTDIDLLVLEDRLLWKSLQPRSATSDDRRPQYDPD
jgi:carbamoyltransferase